MTPRIWYTHLKKRAEKWGPLSVNNVPGHLYLKIQCSFNATATSYSVMRRILITCVILLKRSGITIIKTYPRFLIGIGPNMSVATYSICLVSGKICMGREFLMRRPRFFAQLVHYLTVKYTSPHMCVQNKVLPRWCCMLVWPGWPAHVLKWGKRRSTDRNDWEKNPSLYSNKTGAFPVIICAITLWKKSLYRFSR